MSEIRLEQISIYPIKSTSGIDLSTSWVDEFGLSFDRRFVLSDLQGQFITARTDPKICLIRANLTASGLKLTAPDMPVLTVNYQDFSGQYQPVQVWKDSIQAQPSPDSYSLWFSQYLGKPCRLMYFGQQSRRLVKNSNSQVAFADGYPLLLISRASLKDLSHRARMELSMRQFRPNLVVDGCDAFAEDSWRHIRIGEVEFELTKPCSRCIFTTVNPDTAEKHPAKEPLASLMAYRQTEKGDVMFGQNLVQLNQGQIKLGDRLTVLASKAAPVFITKAEKKAPAQTQAFSEQASEFSLTCIKIQDETHDVKTFTFAGDIRKKIHYIPGQHLPITLTIDNKPVNTCYTLSSSPTRDRQVTITVKRVPGGLVSNYLHDHFKIGDSIRAQTPAGNFHLNRANMDKVLLLSAGSGVTPMLSMLKAMTDAVINGKSANDIVYFHSAHSEADIIAKEEVALMASQHGNCRVSYTLTRNVKPEWQDYQGHINTQMLGNIPDLAERQVFVCGPLGFREKAKELLLSLGLPESHYHFESFGHSTVSSGTVSSGESKAKQREKVSILFDSWDKHVEGNNQETILEQGEDAGLVLPYSCRAGMCGTCKVKLESGEVEQLANDALTDDEEKQGYILACSCIPKTDVVISQA